MLLTNFPNGQPGLKMKRVNIELADGLEPPTG
jgi:hypothetical protein